MVWAYTMERRRRLCQTNPQGRRSWTTKSRKTEKEMDRRRQVQHRGPVAHGGGHRESCRMEKENPCGWPLTRGIHSLKEREKVYLAWFWGYAYRHIRRRYVPGHLLNLNKFNMCLLNAGSSSALDNGAYLSSAPRGRMSRPSQKSEHASSSTSAMPCENICFIPVSQSHDSPATLSTNQTTVESRCQPYKR